MNRCCKAERRAVLWRVFNQLRAEATNAEAKTRLFDGVPLVAARWRWMARELRRQAAIVRGMMRL